MRRVADTPGRVLGIYQRGRIVPTDRRSKAEWLVPPGSAGGAVEGEIVLAEPLPHHRLGLKPARVIERLGAMGDARSDQPDRHPHPRHSAGVPARRAGGGRTRARPQLGRRTDLREIPLVTIDGEDARDFDDAVFAEPTTRLPGFRLIVAIADVAHYVRPGSPLDHAARTRGNSVYFPDRVVPMLPEALSNGWCSLRPDEDRGCLFVELHIDANGAQDRPPLRPRPDAQRRTPYLRRRAAGARRGRRQPSRICMRRSAPCWPPAPRAARSISTCRSAVSCSTTTASCAASRRGRASTATG